MNENNLKYFSDEKKLDIFLLLSICFLPLIILTRSAAINIITFIIILCFIINLNKKEEFNFIIKDKIFIYILLFWISLIINLIFSNNINESFPRILSFVKWIPFIFLIKYYITYKNFKFEKFIYKIWFLIFLIVTFDLIFEYCIGHNVFGFESPMPGRLSGFLNQELKIGNFYYGFILLSLSYFYDNCNKNYIFYFFCLLFVLVSFLIGERSNFIKSIIIVFAFILFINKKRFFIIFICSLFILSTLVIVSFNYENKNNVYYNRYVSQFFIIKNIGIKEYINQSPYGSHYDTALNIFSNYPFFGVGIKNFRNESPKDIYINSKIKFNEQRATTHPHQIHLEFLSETGIFGYISFILFFILSFKIFIKSYFLKKNIYQLSSSLFCISSLLPLIPSGSFFTTYTATIFWLMYGVMISYNK